MSNPAAREAPRDIRRARDLFPATENLAYLNTAAVGLASRALIDAYHQPVDGWTAAALDFAACEAAAESARTSVAHLIGADPVDITLIASVSAAAGLVAAQFGPACPGQNVVIGEREYSSNYFPWSLLAHKGYEVRQVGFRNGGLEPDDIAHAGRGLGYCYLSRAMQDRFAPINAGWKAGRVPFDSSSARPWTYRTRRRGPTTRSAGSPQSETSRRSPSSTISVQKRSTQETASSRTRKLGSDHGARGGYRVLLAAIRSRGRAGRSAHVVVGEPTGTRRGGTRRRTA